MLPLTRRELLNRAGMGFGALGLAGVMHSAGMLAAAPPRPRGPHFAPKAKRVIFLFMNGGPSHVDTFDPKPALAKHEGKKPEGDAGKRAKAGFVPSPFKF